MGNGLRSNAEPASSENPDHTGKHPARPRGAARPRSNLEFSAKSHQARQSGSSGREPRRYICPMNHRLGPGIGRRELLRVLALGASAATTAACVPFVAADSESDPHPDKPRYRVTANVEAFYRVNRY